MDRRKKRTSTNQYLMYIDMMAKDSIFATGRVPRDVDVNYLQKRWKELSDKLNTCGSGPTLTAEEWRKRLTDWKNTTRCKYRRSVTSEDVSLTSMENRALDLFGRVPNVTNSSEQLSIHLKSEKEDDNDDEEEMDNQRTSESFQKELQAAVEEAICGDDDEEAMDEQEVEQDEVPTDPLPTIQNVTSNTGSGANTTTYRTIVVENAHYTDEGEDNEETAPYVARRRQQSTSSAIAAGIQTVVTPTTTVTKLINGDLPIKRIRSHAPEQIVYEVKKAPIAQHHPPLLPQRSIKIHNTNVQQHQTEINPISIHHNTSQSTSSTGAATSATLTMLGPATADARHIARQLKRLADIKAEKLKFEVARFKFKNPGFVYNFHPL